MMFNLLDILQSQAGPGMQVIGQQFGLSPDQSRRAMEALLPALASGLQHSAASDPMGFGHLLGSVGLSPYLDARPSAPQPDILGQLFGSPMLNQAVLQQASLASGVGAQALRQMLPVMAGMVVAGIVHVLLNQGQQPAIQPQPAPAPQPGLPVAWFWNDWVNSYLGGGEPSKPETRPQAAAPPPKPREASGSASSGAPIRPPSPAALPDPSDDDRDATKPAPDEAPFAAFQQMFQTGVQVQEQNAKAMQDIFDAFWSAPLEDVAAERAGRDAAPKSATTPDAAAAAAPRSRRSPKVSKAKTPTARKPASRTRKDAGTKEDG